MRTSNTWAQYRGQSSASRISTSIVSPLEVAAATARDRTGVFQMTDASRAMPTWFRQSGRFAVISKSITPRSTDATSKPRSAIAAATASTSAGTSTSSLSH